MSDDAEQPRYDRMKARGLLDYRVLVLLAVVLGLAPFFPKPHLFEKIQMFRQGTLQRPIDVFDLFFHGWPLLLLAARGVLDVLEKVRSGK